MSSTLTYGRKLPANGDSTWWDDLASNITKDDTHNHDGANSIKLTPANFNKSTGAISSASWVSVAGQAGTYKQTVTVPANYAVDSMQVKFYITGGGEDGHEVALTVRKVTSLTFDVFINDNTINLVAVYG